MPLKGLVSFMYARLCLAPGKPAQAVLKAIGRLLGSYALGLFKRGLWTLRVYGVKLCFSRLNNQVGDQVIPNINRFAFAASMLL